MQQISSLSDFPAEARVWTYLCKNELSESTILALTAELDSFTSNWMAHGVGLKASYAILHKRFIVLVADESKALASGCSIDTSVKFLKQLSAKFELDLFNRLNVLIEQENQPKSIHFSDLSNYPHADIFDPTITTLRQLRSEWKKPVIQFLEQ